MVEAVSSGSPDPDLPTPPAWHKLLLSSLHIISLSCSGINRPPASLSAPMCASRSVCAHSRQSSYPRFHKRVNIKELFHNYYCGHYGNLDCLKKQSVFSSVSRRYDYSTFTAIAASWDLTQPLHDAGQLHAWTGARLNLSDIDTFYLLCVFFCVTPWCSCMSVANRSVHAVRWSSSCVPLRAVGPGWAWRSSWRGSAATSRVPSGRKRKASASGVAARRTHHLAVTHLLEKPIFAACRYCANYCRYHLSSE